MTCAFLLFWILRCSLPAALTSKPSTPPPSGIGLQRYAFDRSKEKGTNLDVCRGDALAVPSRNRGGLAEGVISSGRSSRRRRSGVLVLSRGCYCCCCCCCCSSASFIQARRRRHGQLLSWGRSKGKLATVTKKKDGDEREKKKTHFFVSLFFSLRFSTPPTFFFLRGVKLEKKKTKHHHGGRGAPPAGPRYRLAPPCLSLSPGAEKHKREREGERERERRAPSKKPRPLPLLTLKPPPPPPPQPGLRPRRLQAQDDGAEEVCRPAVERDCRAGHDQGGARKFFSSFVFLTLFFSVFLCFFCPCDCASA